MHLGERRRASCLAATPGGLRPVRRIVEEPSPPLLLNRANPDVWAKRERSLLLFLRPDQLAHIH
jgi:hypothetical protein